MNAERKPLRAYRVLAPLGSMPDRYERMVAAESEAAARLVAARYIVDRDSDWTIASAMRVLAASPAVEWDAVARDCESEGVIA